jgi:hypothetical protein
MYGLAAGLSLMKQWFECDQGWRLPMQSRYLDFSVNRLAYLALSRQH